MSETVREVWYDPEASLALDRLWERNETVANAIEAAVEWIGADNPRSRRRAFQGDVFAIEVRSCGEDWTILWELAEDQSATVIYLGETTSI